MATTNGSNYSRVRKQRFAVPTILVGLSVPMGLLSGLVAPHVADNGFYDAWLGGLSVISGCGAVVVLICATVSGLEAIQRTLSD